MRTDRTLLLFQLDEALAKWREAQLPTRPKNGWIQSIRSALCMSATAMARRLDVTEGAVRKLERNEADDAITLGALRRAADALGCDLQYALVPKMPLEEVLMNQARRAVARQLGPVAHTMALEDQAVNDPSSKKQIDVLARNLLAHGSHRELW